MAQLALVGGIFLLALLAGFVPFISIEVALLLSAATHGSTRVLLALAIAAALGMMVGKCFFFVGGRRAFAWRERRGGKKRFHLPAFVSRATKRPPVAAATVFVSAATGLPPFAVVSPLAGSWRLRLSSFFMVGFAGKMTRFAGIVLVPGLLTAIHP